MLTKYTPVEDVTTGCQWVANRKILDGRELARKSTSHKRVRIESQRSLLFSVKVAQHKSPFICLQKTFNQFT